MSRGRSRKCLIQPTSLKRNQNFIFPSMDVYAVQHPPQRRANLVTKLPLSINSSTLTFQMISNTSKGPILICKRLWKNRSQGLGRPRGCCLKDPEGLTKKFWDEGHQPEERAGDHSGTQASSPSTPWLLQPVSGRQAGEGVVLHSCWWKVELPVS